MMPFSIDYLIPGDCFADETVLCMRCGTKIAGLGYKEMPSMNNPKETVKVAHKQHYSNFSMYPVVLYRRGKQSITYLNMCKDCIPGFAPEEWSDQIIKQIVRAFQIEARWAAMPEAAVEAVSRQYSDARILRAANPEEIREGKIMETV